MSSQLIRNIVIKANNPHDCWKTPNSGSCQKCERNVDNHEGDGLGFNPKDLELLCDMLDGYKYTLVTHPKKITKLYNGSFTIPTGVVIDDITRQPRIVFVMESTVGNGVIAGKVIQAANTLGWSSTCEIRDQILIGVGFADRGGKESYEEAFAKQMYV